MFFKFVDGCLLYFSLAERTLRIIIPLEFSESLTHRNIQMTKKNLLYKQNYNLPI